MSILLQPASEIADAVRSGRLDPVAVVDEALDRIAALNPRLNAFCEVRPLAARAAARSLAERIGRGEDPGPLAGVPVAIKDLVWEAGIETTDGSRALVGFVPDESATLVERLVAAGAILVGRSNVPEFCYRGICTNELYGTTSNPWDPDRVPGGSSGGSAAAVAAGLCTLAVGSDGGGSIRIPSSFCGVAGIKPTFGLVPREPQWPGWYTLTHLGPIGFTVLDCALMLQAMAGPDDRDPTSLPALGRDYSEAARKADNLRGLRVAVSEDLGYVRVDADVRERFRETVARFRRLGAEIEDAHPDLGSPVDAWNTIACADNLASEGPLLATGMVADDTRSLIDPGRGVSGAQYAAARNEQSRVAIAWERFMRRYDLLLTPTMEVVAFPHGRSGPATVEGEPIGDFFDDWCHFSYPSNLTGQPAMSVPMGAATDGMPIGLQLIGRRFADDLVLRAAAAWERLAPWPRPPLATDDPHGPRILDDDARAVAGARVRTADGVRAVRRAWRPDGVRLELVFDG